MFTHIYILSVVLYSFVQFHAFIWLFPVIILVVWVCWWKLLSFMFFWKFLYFAFTFEWYVKWVWSSRLIIFYLRTLKMLFHYLLLASIMYVEKSIFSFIVASLKLMFFLWLLLRFSFDPWILEVWQKYV